MRPLHFLQLERPDLAGSAIKGFEGAAAGGGAASKSSVSMMGLAAKKGL
jgi:hypothetical protein